jgi:hypothetical protein
VLKLDYEPQKQQQAGGAAARQYSHSIRSFNAAEVVNDENAKNPGEEEGGQVPFAPLSPRLRCSGRTCASADVSAVQGQPRRRVRAARWRSCGAREPSFFIRECL